MRKFVAAVAAVFVLALPCVVFFAGCDCPVAPLGGLAGAGGTGGAAGGQ